MNPLSSLEAQAAGYRIRPATPQDIELLWQWANEPEARRHAFRSEPILWATHEAWYMEKLRNPKCLLAILEARDAVPLGQVRFDQGPEGLEVDLSVAAPRRGAGIGHALLRHGLAAAAGRWTAGTLVIAKILEQNVPSMRVFERAGFALTSRGAWQQKRFVRMERTL